MTTKDTRPEIPQEDVVPSLWKRYVNSHEYRIEKRIKSINSAHPIVKAAEQKGLQTFIMHFIGALQTETNLKGVYMSRSRDDWLDEWRSMHNVLFKFVFKHRGSFRVKGHDVYFGNIGDEELYKIPKGGNDTLVEIFGFAANLSVLLSNVNADDVDDVCRFLARVHYGFVRIHPFGDGNGRIARAITDQLAVALGYPPVIAGFPRSNFEEKSRYHAAIRGCAEDPNCTTLYSWIKFKLESATVDIA